MKFGHRLRRLEKFTPGPARCVSCAARPDIAIVWPDDSAPMLQPCEACCWAPLVIEVVYVDTPPPALLQGWQWPG